MKTVKVKCFECKVEFNKRKSEYNRSEKKGMRHFCSNTCSAITRNKELPAEERRRHGYPIKNHANNRLDEYSPFRLYLNKGRASLKKHINDLTPELLRSLWDKQKGICPYTQIQMFLPKTSSEWNLRSLKKASLDRIDSTKNYTKDNVEFVCMAINLAKNSFTREEMKEFLKEVVEPTGIEPVS